MARATFIFRNGKVFTADRRQAFASGLAVAGDRVVAVGDDTELSDWDGRSVRVVDLEGRLVTPGFTDAHVHPGASGLDMLRVPLHDCADAGEAFAAIAAYALANPTLEWIVGSGWSQGWFDHGCPDKEMLDRLVPDRPVLLWNTDGHGAWANSAALRIAGIDATTPDPSDGRIERLDDGSPQGTLHEGAVALVERHLPPETVDDLEAGLLRGQEELLGYGITSWQDAAVSADMQNAYLRLASSGRLKARVVAAMWWDRHRGLEQIDELVERRENGAPGFRPTSVKLMLDGVAENFTASVLSPWLGGDGLPTDNLGIDFIDPGELPEIVTRLDALGFQCHFHSLGDRAVRNALDAVEIARTVNGPSDNRHHLAHLQIVHPDDLPRFAAIGAVANAQPLWACHDTYQDELTIPFLGPERSSWQYPFASLLRAGARLAMGSDWGVSTANVMEEIDVAVTRTSGDGPPFYPEERLSPLEALTAFTSGSAYVNHAEDDTGALGVGMLADLVVLDRDPFIDGPFRDTRVGMTMIGGEVVYEES